MTWVLAGELLDVLQPDTPAAKTPASRVLCELAEMLPLGETSVCTLVPVQLPAAKLTLNLSTAQLRRLDAGVERDCCCRSRRRGIHIMPQRTGG